MSFFDRFKPKTSAPNIVIKAGDVISNDDFDSPNSIKLNDMVKQHSWIDIAYDISIRTITRPNIKIYNKNSEVEAGPVVDLFTSPNPKTGEGELKAQMALSWFDQGEIFLWFGPNYSSGFPKELFILQAKNVSWDNQTKRWSYFDEDSNSNFAILEDEVVHIKKVNKWSSRRGVGYVTSLQLEAEQDFYIKKNNVEVVRNGAIPDGFLKTDQDITSNQAEDIQRKWIQNYSRNKMNKRIAVLGKGAEFKPLNADLVKYLDVITENRTTILAKFGIPLKVANAETARTALSGKDSDEQYKAYWSQTLIPILNYWQSEVKSKLFSRFGMNNMAIKFDLTDISELQEDVSKLHDRLNKDVETGIITINEARAFLGMSSVPWGDTYWKKDNLHQYDKENDNVD